MPYSLRCTHSKFFGSQREIRLHVAFRDSGTSLLAFFGNGTIIGAPAVNAQRQASLNIPSLTTGSHSFAAQFSGTSNYAADGSNYLGISAQ